MLSSAELLDVALSCATRRARESNVHGPAHWERVAAYGLRLLAGERGADPAVVAVFAFLHDTQRWEDGCDPGHGRRAARASVDHFAEWFPDVLAGPQLDLLRRACAGHADCRTSDDPTIGVCWDADRLHLWRCRVEPDPALMSTTTGRESIAWARGL